MILGQLMTYKSGIATVKLSDGENEYYFRVAVSKSVVWLISRKSQCDGFLPE